MPRIQLDWQLTRDDRLSMLTLAPLPSVATRR